MDAKLLLAISLRAYGEKIPTNAHSVCVETDTVSYYNEDDKYIGHGDIDNEWLGHDSYSREVTGAREFTVTEFKEFLAANPGIVEEAVAKERAAIAELAEIVGRVEGELRRGLELSKEHGIPFSVNLSGSETVDLRLAHLVDWNSSSMYC